MDGEEIDPSGNEGGFLPALNGMNWTSSISNHSHIHHIFGSFEICLSDMNDIDNIREYIVSKTVTVMTRALHLEWGLDVRDLPINYKVKSNLDIADSDDVHLVILIDVSYDENEIKGYDKSDIRDAMTLVLIKFLQSQEPESYSYVIPDFHKFPSFKYVAINSKYSNSYN